MALGITYKPMLFNATVLKWQTNGADGWNRVRDKSAGTAYLLNTNRLDGIRTNAADSKISLYYFDNPFDNRDSPHYMELTVDMKMQRATMLLEIIAQMDTVPTHTHMGLKIFPDMDHSETSVTTDIPIANFAFAVAVTDTHSATQSYVYYVDSGWRFKRCRVEQSLAELLALIA
jgi:hypothetical protein